KPDSVVEVQVEKGSNPPALPSEFTPSENIVTELFVKGTEPTEVSDTFDELDPVSNLSVTYNEENEAIEIGWDYESDIEVSFEVSYTIDGGERRELSTTKETEMTVSEVELGATYTIQVVAVTDEDGIKSEPATATITIAEEEEEEIPPVEGLDATYNPANETIQVTWQYNGPPAEFEVDINGQTQT